MANCPLWGHRSSPNGQIRSLGLDSVLPQFCVKQLTSDTEPSRGLCAIAASFGNRCANHHLFKLGQRFGKVTPKRDSCHGKKMLGQRNNILAPFAQWQYMNIDDVEPIKQIFAKPAFRNLLPKITMSGSEQVDIYCLRMLRARGTITPSASTRRSLACRLTLISPISSSSKVPPSAWAKMPA